MKHPIELISLYKEGEFSDVKFVLRDKNDELVEIPAHRLILSSRSSVFKRMFYGDFKDDGNIKITDATAEVFSEFLQLFYLADVNLTSDNIGEVLKLIDKYDTATAFWPTCENFLWETRSLSTAIEYYELALQYGLSDDIKDELEDYLGENRRLVFGVTGSMNASDVVRANILKSDRLRGREYDIFCDVVTWAKAALEQSGEEGSPDNIKEMLADLLTNIRFPTMSSKEMMDIFDAYPYLVTVPEVLDLLQFKELNRALTVAKRFRVKERLFNYIEIPMVLQSDVNASMEDRFLMEWSGKFPATYSISFTTETTSYSNVKLYRNGSSIHSRKYNGEEITVDTTIEFGPTNTSFGMHVDYDYYEQYSGNRYKCLPVQSTLVSVTGTPEYTRISQIRLKFVR